MTTKVEDLTPERLLELYVDAHVNTHRPDPRLHAEVLRRLGTFERLQRLNEGPQAYDLYEAFHMASDAPSDAPSDLPTTPSGVVCECCHVRPATCVGAYEGTAFPRAACDVCCGHGNEDGRCVDVDSDEALAWARAARDLEDSVRELGIDRARAVLLRLVELRDSIPRYDVFKDGRFFIHRTEQGRYVRVEDLGRIVE